MTLEQLMALSDLIECEERSAHEYNIYRDRDPVEAAYWKRSAESWRRLIVSHCGLRRVRLDPEIFGRRMR